MKHLILLSSLLILTISPALSLTSKDAYVIRKGDAWTLGTAKVERAVILAKRRSRRVPSPRCSQRIRVINNPREMAR